MIIRTLLAMLVFATVLSSCADDLPVPGSDTPSKLVLLGELTAGQSFSIRAGQSAVMGSTAVPIPQALTITVKDGEGGVWTIPGMQDSLSEELRTVVISTSNIVIRAGGRYTVTAQHPGLATVEAVVDIPQPVVATLMDTARGMKWGTPVQEARIQIQDAPGQHFYVIEAVKQPTLVKHEFLYAGQWQSVQAERLRYDSLIAAGIPLSERRDTIYSARSTRISLYTDDVATENVRVSGFAQPETYRRVLLTDRTFNGGSHITTVHIPSDSLVGLGDMDLGRVRLQVKSVAKEYFDFLMRYERTDPETAAEPNTLQANVVGGYGAVGGAAKVEWVWMFGR